MKKVPDHLRYLDPIVAMVDKMTPQERCNAAGYHLVVDGVCACGYLFTYQPIPNCVFRMEIPPGKGDKSE